MAEKNTYRLRGKTYPVLRRMTIGRKPYLLVRKLSSSDRQRWQAIDPHAGPGGDMRAIWIIPRSQSSRQHLDTLQRLSQNSPGVPAILEYHDRGKDFVVVMPWVWGQDLRSYLKDARKGKFHWPSVVSTFNYFRRFAHSLRALHSRNLVHGDLKPENLIFCRETGHMVMIDFGSAWTVEKTARRAPGDGQTDAYASPEQHAGQANVDFRSDMFSASVIGYEMLTAEVPYARMGGRAGIDTNRADFADRLVPPSQCRIDKRPLPAGVSKKIDHVITTGLELDARNRFRSDGVWLDALDDIDTDLNRRRTRKPSLVLQTALDLLPETWRQKWFG